MKRQAHTAHHASRVTITDKPQRRWTSSSTGSGLDLCKAPEAQRRFLFPSALGDQSKHGRFRENLREAPTQTCVFEGNLTWRTEKDQIREAAQLRDSLGRRTRTNGLKETWVHEVGSGQTQDKHPTTDS